MAVPPSGHHDPLAISGHPAHRVMPGGCGCPAEAADADRRAVELTQNKAEQDFLAARLAEPRQP
jgi:hypothetical protein